jgi:hypothetical protein
MSDWQTKDKANRLSTAEMARAYVAGGLSVIPIALDGSKAPDCRALRKVLDEGSGNTRPTWTPYKERLPTDEELTKWFAHEPPPGVGIVGGKVSGNLLILDVEFPDFFAEWRDLVEAVRPGLLERLPIVQTPGKGKEGGRHVYARSSGPSVPTGKLARIGRTEAEQRTGDSGRTTAIEVKAEKGYVLAPGCPANCHPSGRLYEHVSGPSIEETPTLDESDVNLLLACARALERGDEANADLTRPGEKITGLRPGDDFNRRADWGDLLPGGWRKVHENGEIIHLRRPGKEDGVSATIGYCRSERAGPKLYVFSTNAAPFAEKKSYSKFEAYTLLNHGGDFKAAARELARQGYGEQAHHRNGHLRLHSGSEAVVANEPRSAGGDRSTITISTEEHEVNADAVAALQRDDAIYQRGGMLVRVVRDVSPAAKGIRRAFSPRIEALPPALLRERLAANAVWMTLRETSEGAVEKPAHPPAWCVSAVHARADWPGIRHLESVVDYPVLRPDGTILCRPGYDRETGLLLESASQFPTIPDQPSKDEAVAALNALQEVVSDFPFESDLHRAAWLAALLTPLARFAFTGPAPLFLVDANVRAAGKGLLLDTISRIVTGERFTIATYTADEDELRKRITSLVMAGDRLVLFDNLEGKFGNAVLDAALTATAWKDRVLGVNRMAEAPLYVTWYGTGNNVAIAADTARRVCHVRLESPEERPEERNSFRHSNLLAWVGANRARLLAAALTILRGYFVAGRPNLDLPAWGSFEGWSAVVRSAVVWAGLPDPGETRLLLQQQADVAAESMGVILACWERLDPDRRGLTAAEVMERLYKHPPLHPPDYYADLRDALESLLAKPDSRLLGNKLRTYRRRVFQGRFIDQAGKEQRAARWAVFPAEEFRHRTGKTHQTHETHPTQPSVSECGESRESFPIHSESNVDKQAATFEDFEAY